MKKKYTINEAKARILALDNEIDYLIVLTDSKVRERREMHLEVAPKSIRFILNRELVAREQEKDNLEKFIDKYMEEVRVVPTYSASNTEDIPEAREPFALGELFEAEGVPADESDVN